ncbi:MAG: carboxylesterase/lipase family protein [Acidobacteria bacterium]|nr:carboxylesterase/lipase family protein [Acidobacteriota bacterium]
MHTKNAWLVRTAYGRVEGNCEDGQYVFRGIPYAAAPAGRLRWHAPQPPEPWNGVRPAREFGPVAPQNPLPGMEAMADFAVTEPQDEDCLYLNIWTPGTGRARCPVMVWIHGGAFIVGSGSQEMFRGNTLVPGGDVVLVTINYRMGALGFLNLEEITQGRIPATGCEGLLDQITALDWIRENIEAFGGDPDNVTVFGESAGAMSIGNLLGMPAAEGKFRKAILESGGAATVGTLQDGVAVAEQFLQILQVKGTDSDALLALTVPRILEAQQKLAALLNEKDGRLTPFQPVVDGTVMPEVPIHAIEKGSAKGIPVLAGTNLDEFRLFNALDRNFGNMDEAGMARRLEAIIPPERVPGFTATYGRALKQRGADPVAGDILTAIQSDYMFRIPVLRLVEAQCRNGRPAFNYLFTWKSPLMKGKLGACHTLEIGFVFGNYDERFHGAGPDAAALSRKMQDAWIAFARTGNPGCESLGAWEPYGDRRNVMVLDKECRLETAPYEQERRVWDGFEMPLTKPI